MKIIELTKQDFLTKIANYETSPDEWKFLGDKPALIDFLLRGAGLVKWSLLFSKNWQKSMVTVSIFIRSIPRRNKN